MDAESAVACAYGGVGLSISDQCRILRISRCRYYQWRERQGMGPVEPGPEAVAARDEKLRLVKAILGTWGENPAWGYRKMGKYLQGKGMPNATEKRVRLIYRRLGISGVAPVFKTTRPPKGKCLKFPYLLKGKKVSFPNQVWSTDITYIKLPTGMVYLTAIIDLYSRKILAWSLSTIMEAGFCVDALHEAVAKYGIPAIFNTDCGSQYLSNDFVGALQGYGIEISNDSVGRCLDNILIERTWRTVKYECVFLNDWRTYKELEDGLRIFIDRFNSERPHQGLDYRTPDDVYKEGCFPNSEDSNKKTEVA